MKQFENIADKAEVQEQLSPPSPKKSLQDLIRYPQLKMFEQEIGRCLELTRLYGEPQCLSLEGVTGAGKSTLVSDYIAQYPIEYHSGGSRVQVLYVLTPSPATIKGLACQMLSALGDPAANRGTLWSMNSRLIKLIRACGVSQIILDEFSHLYELETNHILGAVSDWLKTIIKETGVPVVVVGIEGRVEIILKANPQLSRLFAKRLHLKPFDWDPTEMKANVPFDRFVRYAEQAVGLSMDETLLRDDVLCRIHYATEGVVGNVMNLLRACAIQARDEGKTIITLQLLSMAYRDRLASHMRLSDPFVMPKPPTSSQSSTQQKTNATTEGKRAVAKSRQDPPLSQVLRAS